VHVVHVIEPEVYPLVPPSEWRKMAQEERQFRDEKKRQIEEDLRAFPHEVLFLQGNVWKNLSNVIEEKDIDLLVLSTHGRTGIKKALMGSVAEEVFRQAECPVLVVGPGVSSRTSQTATAELDSIVYPTDFSSESFAAVPYAISLAKVHHAQLTLMHSIHDLEAGQLNSAFQTLRDVIPFATVLGSKPKYLVERGSPVDCILQVAEKENADMIVLGVRSAEGHLMAATHLSRSVAHQVIAQATCPVLTVRG
jgi:nucleotide-binding universal stress UspA family protein